MFSSCSLCECPDMEGGHLLGSISSLNWLILCVHDGMIYVIDKNFMDYVCTVAPRENEGFYRIVKDSKHEFTYTSEMSVVDSSTNLPYGTFRDTKATFKLSSHV